MDPRVTCQHSWNMLRHFHNRRKSYDDLILCGYDVFDSHRRNLYVDLIPSNGLRQSRMKSS